MRTARFFDTIDLDMPGLEETRQWIAQGRLELAKAAFAEYLRARKRPRYFIDWRDKPAPGDRPSAPDTRIADDALQLRYTVESVPFQFTGKIDWTANPTQPFDPEWTWQLSRHYWWPALGRAYWDTGDEKYARQFVLELRSWVHDNPMPDRADNGVGSRWRTIECGIRLAWTWPAAFAYFLSSPTFTPDDVVLMLQSMAEQAEYLLQNPTGGNWLTMEANGMGHVGVLFPEFKRAAVWREQAIGRLHRELDAQVYPDGVQKELSTGYHYVALRNFAQLAHLFLFNDLDLPKGYLDRLERMWDVGMWIMMPDRTLPPVNDATQSSVLPTLREALEYFPQRDDFRWIATGGREGNPPAHTSHFFPWAGWAVMRSGWGPTDNYLFFDVGPFGAAHQHEDKLAFLIHARGRYLVIDTGSYWYDSSPMRQYVLGPYAHNVVFVDGQAQHRRGLARTYVNPVPQTDNHWQTTPDFDYCEGTYAEGFGADNALNVVHRRRILFVKPEYWIVVDALRPCDNAPHQYMALFHLGTPHARVEDNTVLTVGSPVRLHLLATGPRSMTVDVVRGQRKPYMLGWQGTPNEHSAHPIPVARFRWQAQGLTRVLYVFYPGPSESQPMPTLRLTSSSPLRAEFRYAQGQLDHFTLTENEWEVTREDARGRVNRRIRVRLDGP